VPPKLPKLPPASDPTSTKRASPDGDDTMPYAYRIQVVVQIIAAAISLGVMTAAIWNASVANRNAAVASANAKLAKESADRAWMMFELQRRPWLAVRLAVKEFCQGGRYVRFRLVVKNCGVAPAVSVAIYYKDEPGPVRCALAGSLASEFDWANKGTLYLPSGDSFAEMSDSLRYFPATVPGVDTSFYHVCCLFTNAESRVRYFYETVYRMMDVRKLRPDDPRDNNYHWGISSYGTSFFGRVINDTFVLDTLLTDGSERGTLPSY
jgi:hypothetical protein